MIQPHEPTKIPLPWQKTFGCRICGRIAFKVSSHPEHVFSIGNRANAKIKVSKFSIPARWMAYLQNFKIHCPAQATFCCSISSRPCIHCPQFLSILGFFPFYILVTFVFIYLWLMPFCFRLAASSAVLSLLNRCCSSCIAVAFVHCPPRQRNPDQNFMLDSGCVCLGWSQYRSFVLVRGLFGATVGSGVLCRGLGAVCAGEFGAARQSALALAGAAVCARAMAT